ncbi:MAG: Cna protein B-type domain, TonB-dependent Receptor Plug Domain protein [Acidobacteria bacterium]|nr:Cna protein B-type domain, TonB-dependent Receptor Plug Domain protein [Acidobacteriota bacterium]
MTSRNKSGLILALCILLVASATAMSQSQTTGRIVGTVTDEKGGVIPGADITVTNKATGEERKTVADESGHFIVPLLAPGSYTVVVTGTGFKKFISEDVRVALTETSTVNAALVVGSVAETVTVNAAPPLVQTEGAQLGRVVDSRAVSELPLATRNFTQILGLSPGAATYLPDNTAVGRNSQNISVNGGRVTNNNFQINGVDANSMGTNSAPSLAIPAPETIQEFKVQTSLYDATFGRSGGGNIQAVTKSGSNSLHGGAYEYLRNQSLNANNPFLKAAGVARPVLKRNVFGGLLGGPIKKDKAFFFVSYQGTRERNGASPINSLSSNVLVDPKLTNDRSEATLKAAYGLAAIHPTALALLNTKLSNGQFLIPTPTAANGTYSGSTPSIFNENQFNGNIDYRLNDKNTFAFKFFYSNAPQTLVLPSFLGGGPNVPGFGNFQQNNNRLLTMQYVHIFSPNVFNELRAGYNFIRVDAFPEEPVNDSALGINRVNANAFPGLGLIRINAAAGGVVIGTSATIDVKAKAPSTTLADTLSITKGKHNFRVGGEYRYNENNYVLNFFTRGQVDFLSFTNFLQGTTFVSIFGSGIGDRSLRASDYNLYAQDDWKVNRKLTLNMGLRYELDLPAYDTRGRIATFDPTLYVPRPAIGGAVVGPPIGGYVQAGNVIPQYDVASMPNVGKRVVNSVDPNNFAPRVGFAYSPLESGKLVVRGGYGIFYSRTSFQYITLNVIAPPTYVFGVNVGAPLSNPFFPAPAQNQFPTLVPGVALSGTLFDRGIRTPYIQQYNVNAQYEVLKDYLFEVAYVGTHGINLFRQIAINQSRLASTANPITNAVTGAVITTNTAANAALRAPFQGVSLNGFFQNQSTAQSNYNSLQVSLTRRFSQGLQFLASYTFAKSIDNASGQGGGAGIGGVLNPGAVGETSAILGNQRNNRANRGISDFDRKHRFVFSALYDLPKPKFAGDSAVAKWLLSDWQLAAIATSMSGLPIDIADTGAGSFYGLSGGSAPLARPNLVSNPFSNVPAGYYFNPFAFARPVVVAGAVIPSSGGTATAAAVGTDFGNVGRNILRGPHQNNVDFSIIKRFRFAETKSLEFRTEFFNLFNNVNFANPISDLNAVPATNFNADGTINQALGAGRFGKIISASNNPRLVQFALKFNF